MRVTTVRTTQPIFAAILLSATLAPQSLPAQKVQRIALRDAVTARQAVVRLADLLPADASEQLRTGAGEIALGDAPLPGVHRTLQRMQLLRALRGVPELRDALDVPPAIDVARWSRPLTREEVCAAIRQILRANQFEGADSLRAQDVEFSSAIAVTEEAPALRVTRIEPALDGVGTRVRLWIASEPGVPPFWVKVARAINPMPGIPAQTTRSRGRESVPTGRKMFAMPGAGTTAPALNVPADVSYQESHARETLRANRRDSPVVIQSGKRVRVVIEGPGIRITTTAVALDPGRQGQRIRVRALPSRMILTGTVAAAGTVEVLEEGG